uniref:Uncharacterized protein n=1 Tax=Myoviridae sp. ctIty1 TaxID=2827673 RepID=A0A8S5THC4_9CAUD|nr:MAG TPA: hypothetical protein [Myoviridae sp. ctIty1]
MATRRRRNKKVSAKETVQQQEPVVIETPVEIVEQPVAQQETVATEPVKEEVVATPVAEETTQDSSKKEYIIAKPMLFTGDIKDLIPDGMNNGLNNPALEIPQQWQQQQNIQQPQPVQQTIAQVEVQNPQAMGSEQKAALEQSIALKKEEQQMVKQDQLDQINENKIEKQEAEQMEQVNKLEALIGAKIAEAGNAQQEEKSLKDAFVEGAVIGIGAGVGTVAGIYVADKAIGAFEEWRNTKDAAEETSKLISGLL